MKQQPERKDSLKKAANQKNKKLIDESVFRKEPESSEPMVYDKYERAYVPHKDMDDDTIGREEEERD